MVRHTAEREQVSWKRDIPPHQTRRDEMPTQGTHLISLLHRQDTCWIRSRLELRRELVCAGGFNNEIRAGTRTAAAGIASTGPQPVGRPRRQLSHPLHEIVALDVRIQSIFGAEA